MRMRMIVTAAAAVLALAACTPRSSGGGNTAQMGAQGNLNWPFPIDQLKTVLNVIDNSELCLLNAFALDMGVDMGE